MSKEDTIIEILASQDGRIAYKDVLSGKAFELEPTSTKVVGPEGYVNITEGMWIAIPVGGGESWNVDILVDENGRLVLFVEMLDIYIKADRITIPLDYLNKYRFESKGFVNLTEKISEAKKQTQNVV